MRYVGHSVFTLGQWSAIWPYQIHCIEEELNWTTCNEFVRNMSWLGWFSTWQTFLHLYAWDLCDMISIWRWGDPDNEGGITYLIIFTASKWSSSYYKGWPNISSQGCTLCYAPFCWGNHTMVMIISRSHVLQLCLPLLMEKLSSDVISAKVDSLLTLVGVLWQSQSNYRNLHAGSIQWYVQTSHSRPAGTVVVQY